MAHSIGNTKNITAGSNTGKIGADNVINISGEFNLCTPAVVAVSLFQFLQFVQLSLMQKVEVGC